MILVTHAVKWLPLSDHLIVMSAEGRISQSGSFQTLAARSGYIQDLRIEQQTQIESRSAPVQATKEDKPKTTISIKQVPEEKSKNHRGKGDSRNFFYYLATLGKANMWLFLTLATAQVVFLSIQRKVI